MKWLLTILAALFGMTFLAGPAVASSPYAVSGRCAGFPKVPLTTRPGYCVGLVGSGLAFPRGIVEHKGDFYITDMGSWLPNRGRLLRVRLDRQWKPVVALPRLDRPSSILTGADGYIYIADPDHPHQSLRSRRRGERPANRYWPSRHRPPQPAGTGARSRWRPVRERRRRKR